MESQDFEETDERVRGSVIDDEQVAALADRFRLSGEAAQLTRLLGDRYEVAVSAAVAGVSIDDHLADLVRRHAGILARSPLPDVPSESGAVLLPVLDERTTIPSRRFPNVTTTVVTGLPTMVEALWKRQTLPSGMSERLNIAPTGPHVSGPLLADDYRGGFVVTSGVGDDSDVTRAFEAKTWLRSWSTGIQFPAPPAGMTKLHFSFWARHRGYVKYSSAYAGFVQTFIALQDEKKTYLTADNISVTPFPLPEAGWDGYGGMLHASGSIDVTPGKRPWLSLLYGIIVHLQAPGRVPLFYDAAVVGTTVETWARRPGKIDSYRTGPDEYTEGAGQVSYRFAS